MARLPVPGPRDLLRLTTGSYQALEQAVALVPRVSSLIDQVERVVQRADTLVAEVERTRQRTDQVVEQAGALETDILPILATLDTVGPDVRELLETTKEFNEILGSVPGLGRIKKRVEERQELLDSVRE